MTGARLLQRVGELAAAGDRVVIGIAGCPGAGKSTLAGWLAEHLTAAGLPAVWVPMDGFHLADVELERLGRRDRKGAPDTFDALGFAALLRRVREDRDDVIERRLREAAEEIRKYEAYDYVLINRDLAESVTVLSAIVHAERVRRSRIEDQIRPILETFQL